MNRLDIYTKLSPLLRPFGLPYAMITRLRRQVYENGCLSRYAPSVPCVSIGNIAWGGTGKTPLTGWLLDWAADKGLHAAVLSRGYGGTPQQHPLRVRADSSPVVSGDEPLMLARQFPEASIVVCPQRRRSAAYAEKELRADMLLLDDGMQHLAVMRDMDIVLLRPEDLEEEWDRVIPSGSWREGARALSTASAFAVKADEKRFSALSPLAHRRLVAFDVPLFSFTLKPEGLRALFPLAESGSDDRVKKQSLSPAWIARLDGPYILVSGVGNPKDVERDATALMGRPPLQHFAFDDHHAYSTVDVQAMAKLAAAPLPVVCTAKDAVKLEAFAEEFGTAPVWVMETRLAHTGRG